MIRLDPTVFEEKFFPMSRPFQESSWGFGLDSTDELPKLNDHLKLKKLSELTVPVSFIVGDLDQRVRPEEVQAIYDQLPVGNKRFAKISGLGHDFSDEMVFGTVVRPELERLVLQGTPNLACTGDNDLLEGMNRYFSRYINSPFL